MNQKMDISSPDKMTATFTAEYCREIHQSRILDYESMLKEGYRRFMGPGAVAIDIGAHVGYHYDALKQMVDPGGRVIGFEPVPAFAEQIIARHGEGAELIQKALLDEPGRGSFLYMPDRPGHSGFKEREGADDRLTQPIEIEITTLDAELPDLDRCDYIKIDSEGTELKALDGGAELIRRTRPIISIEYGEPTYSLFGLTAESLWHWAEERGYLLSDLFGNIVRNIEEWSYVCDLSYWDYFLIPTEKRDYWNGLFFKRPTTLIELKPG